MRKIMNKPPTFIIDGIPLADISMYELSVDYDQRSHREYNVTISAPHFTITAKPIATKVEETPFGVTIHIYGPLRMAFPSLFKDKEPFDWQKAYIHQLHSDANEYMYFRDDKVFESKNAKWFERGFKEGRK
jgi:hypothetical protein